MNLHIDEVIKKKTIKCPSNFYCLSGGECLGCDKNKPMCKAVRYIRYNGLIVKPSSEHECPYRFVIENGSTCCHCPTRIEIFIKYRK
jgi:hypothetical protein